MQQKITYFTLLEDEQVVEQVRETQNNASSRRKIPGNRNSVFYSARRIKKTSKAQNKNIQLFLKFIFSFLYTHTHRHIKMQLFSFY